MPRKARLLIDNGYYHIISRGNDKRMIFKKEDDFREFKTIVSKYLPFFRVFIMHYCLMPNHIHMLVQSQKAQDLPKFMQSILQVYACYFRKIYKSVGFVFQNRYKSKLIENETYLLECARYIERNPFRGNLCQNVSEYPWSSYHYYASGLKDDIINKINPCFLILSNHENTRRQYYREYINENRSYHQIIDDYFKIN